MRNTLLLRNTLPFLTGAPLQSDADFTWSVAWQDDSGSWSDFAEPGSFSTGLLGPANADWRARHGWVDWQLMTLETSSDVHSRFQRSLFGVPDATLPHQATTRPTSTAAASRIYLTKCLAQQCNFSERFHTMPLTVLTS